MGILDKYNLIDILCETIPNRSRAQIPPSAVKTESSTLKFPTLSAKNPAKGGVKMNKIGITALITATSVILKKKQNISFKPCLIQWHAYCDKGITLN